MSITICTFSFPHNLQSNPTLPVSHQEGVSHRRNKCCRGTSITRERELVRENPFVII